MCANHNPEHDRGRRRRGSWRRLVGRAVGRPIRCRDEYGRRCTLSVEHTSDGVVVVPSLPGPLLVARLDAGRLRRALRDAVLANSADESAPW